ncbi:sulfatase-like hydrolase/transferase [Altererythrobacter salegens]|uniref:Sulfatase-like hydrolase/transferase n=1 Tax=Croceibacterium salegens TaxID=1737568 RepID=A0A6I4SYZ2_9SPHN|nr:sulfatase-like hydrolase/transferase [Croceibacterium salegens]MXO61201.1 sulfatase-like hydrolase/transferase [Croceibacterium salegens]
MKPSSASSRPGRSWWRALAGVALFTLAYALANRFQLVNGVLYRWAANDSETAIRNFLLLAGQALALLGALWLLPRRWAGVALGLAFASILVNLGYGQTVGDALSTGTLAWIGEEARQAGEAAGELTGPLALAVAQALIATGLLVWARVLLRRALGSPISAATTVVGLVLLALPNLALLSGWPTAFAAERNFYTFGYSVLAADPPPPRAAVELAPVTAGTPDHIVWLIDESVAYTPFTQIVLPEAQKFEPVDFGAAVSLGNCSAPSNVALRSGVDVRHAAPGMYLRTTPSIWGYARKAGYRTMLVDGQTTGVPQNVLLAPERALIDEVVSMADGIDTDRTIAAHLNAQLKGPERTFTYVVLRGVHFQYRDHYPLDTLPDDAPGIEQYRAALTYSKRGFFTALFDGVDREKAAVIYTSDHGQNLIPGKLPHCSRERVPAEYDIPLLAFLPQGLASNYAVPVTARHSASQILPTTLEWMGYDPETVQTAYDIDLSGPPAAYVRFGRTVVPVSKGDRVDVEVSTTPPQ